MGKGRPKSPRNAFARVEGFDPWERQPGESPRAFRAFAYYRDMDKRSVDQASLDLGYKSKKSLFKWSQVHHWHERAALWDEHKDALVRQNEIELADKKHRDKLLVADALWRLAGMGASMWRNYMANWIQQNANNPAARPPVKLSDVAKLAELGIKLSDPNQDLGEAAAILQGNVTFYIPDNGRNQLDDGHRQRESESEDHDDETKPLQ